MKLPLNYLILTAKHVREADMYGNNWGCPLARAASKHFGFKMSAGVETITGFPDGRYIQYLIDPSYSCRNYKEDKEKVKSLPDDSEEILRTFKITKI